MKNSTSYFFFNGEYNNNFFFRQVCLLNLLFITNFRHMNVKNRIRSWLQRRVETPRRKKPKCFSPLLLNYFKSLVKNKLHFIKKIIREKESVINKISKSWTPPPQSPRTWRCSCKINYLTREEWLFSNIFIKYIQVRADVYA